MSHQHFRDAYLILAELGIPIQKNAELKASVFLALLNLTPEKFWRDVQAPLIGITPIIQFINENYRAAGTEMSPIAPNTRENVRDECVNIFVEAGLVVANPDKPARPKNSPRYVYQLEANALKLISTYGTENWEENLREYKGLRPSLVERYAKEREHLLIPVSTPDGLDFTLSPGPHSELIKDIIKEFGARFAPGSKLLYAGDTGKKWGEGFAKLLKDEIGFTVDSSSKMPDVILFNKDSKWLYLVESVVSGGHIDGKRYDELARLFGGLGLGIVYVTAFPDFRIMSRFAGELMWDTEVWIATDPSHLIHYNGDRFFGPRKLNDEAGSAF